jgi:Putative auto-transporter adhesin, head GIN domain
MLHFGRVSVPAALLLAFATVGLQSLAATNQLEVKEIHLSDHTPGLTTFAHLSSTSREIVIFVESAAVRVVHDVSAGDITISSNCPRDWNIDGTMVRQAGFNTPHKGVSMMADALGSRAIVNGRVYLLPSGKMSGLSLGSDGVKVGGESLEPLAGTDFPGTCEGPDIVEVTVPDTYDGNLVLAAAGGSDASIDSWKGGDLKCTILGDSKLEAGKLSTLAKAALDVHGPATAKIGDLSAKIVVANVAGSGSLNIEWGSADITNATVSGDGKIIMKGHFNNLKQAIEGNGSIKVN